MYEFNMIKACIHLGYGMVGFCLMIVLIVNSEICFHVVFGYLFKKKYILSEFSATPLNSSFCL